MATTTEDFLAKLAAIGAVISGVAGGVGAVLAVVEAFKTFEDILGAVHIIKTSDDKLDELLRDVGQLFEILKAQGHVTQMQEVATFYQSALAQLDPLTEFRPGDPNFESQRGDMLNKTGVAVRTLGDQAFWIRPFFADGVFSSFWSGTLNPPLESAEGASVVFDYRLTLPAYLQCIAIRVSVLRALDPRFPSTARQEIIDIINRLQEVYSTITAAIVTLRPPTFDEWFGFPANPNPLAPTPAWTLAQRQYGAAELYSGMSRISEYPGEPFPFLQDAHQFFQKVLAKHGIATVHQRINLYADLGLPSVFALLQQLRALIGLTSLEPDRVGVWSFREIHDLVSQHIPDPSTGRPPTFKNVLSRLDIDLAPLVRLRDKLNTVPS